MKEKKQSLTQETILTKCRMSNIELKDGLELKFIEARSGINARANTSQNIWSSLKFDTTLLIMI